MIEQQRIDLEPFEARQVGSHLRQFDQQARDPDDRFPGIVAVFANQSTCPRTVDELFRQPHVERRQRRLAIRHDIDLVAPGAEDDDRAELRISRDAGTQLQRALAALHGLETVAVDGAVRQRFTDTRLQTDDRIYHAAGLLQVLNQRDSLPTRFPAIAKRFAVVTMDDLDRPWPLQPFGGPLRLLQIEHVLAGGTFDTVGPQHVAGFLMGQPIPLACQGIVDERMTALAHLGTGAERQRWRGLLQQVLDLAIAHQMQEGSDGLLRRHVAGNAGAVAGRTGIQRLLQPHPAHQQAMPEALARLDQRIGGRQGWRQSCRRVQDQHRIDIRVARHDLQRTQIIFRRGAAAQIDRIAPRSADVQLLRYQRLRRCFAEFGQQTAAIDQFVDRQQCRADTIGDDRQAVALRRLEPGQRFQCIEQLVGIVDAHDPGTGQRGIDDGIATIDAGRRRNRAQRRLGGAPALDRQHQMVTRRFTQCRHEVARIAERLQMQQQRPAAPGLIQVVDDVRQLDVEAIAQRHQMRKTDLTTGGPVDHRIAQHARLAQVGDAAIANRLTGVGRVEPHGRNRDAEAFRPQHPHAGLQRRLLQPRPQRSLPPGAAERLDVLAERRSARYDQRRPDLPGTQLFQHLGHAVQGRADDGEIRCLGKVGNTPEAGHAMNLLVTARIDRPDRAGKPCQKQVLKNDSPGRLGLGGSSDHHQ